MNGPSDVLLGVRVGDLALANPILVASGTYGSGVETADQVDLSRIGGVVTKSVTSRPRRGNPPPRIVETPSGLLNSIGLMNPGVDAFMERVMPALRELPCRHIVNLAGESEQDFRDLVRRFDGTEGVDALELNVSCPNVAGGLDFGADPGLLEALVSACREATERPLWVKLTPNVTDVTLLARAAERGGADALSLVNTFRGLAVDWRSRRPRLGSPTGGGGLSGPAIRPLALHAVAAVHRAVEIPVVGIGGIASADDVLEFVVAGATAVQIGTGNFRDPHLPVRIADDLGARLAQEGEGPLREMVGTLRLPDGPGRR